MIAWLILSSRDGSRHRSNSFLHFLIESIPLRVLTVLNRIQHRNSSSYNCFHNRNRFSIQHRNSSIHILTSSVQLTAFNFLGLFRCKHGSLGCWYFIQLRQNDYSGWCKTIAYAGVETQSALSELKYNFSNNHTSNKVGIVPLDRAIPNAEYAELDLKMSQRKLCMKGSYEGQRKFMSWSVLE
ncbi:hypothetical protein P8452_52140 [Trifolium repens]|nr:hypothetical protein P8452_52140 [Trifolium repens]